ncbi:MAG: CoA pyrophosphatase [Flammeovirgaceae bacterium]|nr:MAG: CoA pyrophosphatase [Flammeovirgaceae bacterium]
MYLTDESFLKTLTKRLAGKLPGSFAHEPLRAKPVGQVIPRFEHKTPPRPGSVLILLCPQTDSFIFPLIKRPDYSGLHSGQISLPGGKAESGETAVETALREAQEEIGIDPAQVNVLGRLTDFFVVPSNFMVTPVVGFAKATPVFKPDQHEVVKILMGKLSDILDDSAIKSKEIVVANRYTMLAPHFEIDGEIVWGATAMMLNEFRLVLRDVL